MTFYNWDEKSRMTRAVPPAGPVTLTYTADGHRVAKSTATQVRKFIYDFEKVLQETDGTNTTTKEYTSTEEQYGNLLSRAPITSSHKNVGRVARQVDRS